MFAKFVAVGIGENKSTTTQIDFGTYLAFAGPLLPTHAEIGMGSLAVRLLFCLPCVADPGAATLLILAPCCLSEM